MFCFFLFSKEFSLTLIKIVIHGNLFEGGKFEKETFHYNFQIGKGVTKKPCAAYFTKTRTVQLF